MPPPAQAPAALVDGDAQRAQRAHDGAHLVADGDDERGRRGPQRPEPGAAAGEGDAHVGAVEAVRLAPPPRRRHAARAPVLLGVGDGAVEVDRRRSPTRAPPADARAQQPRVPVLAEARDDAGPGRARRRRRRGHGSAARRRSTSRRASAPRSTRSERSSAANGVARRAAPRPRGAAHASGSVAERTRAAGVRRQRRPCAHGRPARVAADGDDDDDDGAGPRLRDAPEVALHADAVVAARVAEGRVGAGGAVGGQHRRACCHRAGSVLRDESPPGRGETGVPASGGVGAARAVALRPPAHADRHVAVDRRPLRDRRVRCDRASDARRPAVDAGRRPVRERLHRRDQPDRGRRDRPAQQAVAADRRGRPVARGGAADRRASRPSRPCSWRSRRASRSWSRSASALAIGWAYSCPPLRLKRYPALAARLDHLRALAGGQPRRLAALRRHAGRAPGVWALSRSRVPFCFAIAVLKDVPDIEGDRRFGSPPSPCGSGRGPCSPSASARSRSAGSGWRSPARCCSTARTPRCSWPATCSAWRRCGAGRCASTRPTRVAFAAFYQRVWQLFFCEYLLVPLAYLVG